MSLEALKNNAKSIQAVNGKIRAIGNDIIVEDMNFGMRETSGGIVLVSDDGKDTGIKPRWGKVHAVGPEQTDVNVGEWILIEHGRWTRSWRMFDGENTVELWKADPEKILATWTGDGEPQDTLFGQFEGAGDTAQARPEDFGAN
jgi:co-chaperonin GroES (HSP10)